MTQVRYPVFKGRLVMGSPTQLRTTTHENKPEIDENKHHWFMGFAVPKGPEWDQVWATMHDVAASDVNCTSALCDQAGFNWKIEDCDAPENPQNLGKASYPSGHMLIKFSRYKAMGPVSLVDGNYQPIINPDAFKRGDWFHVAGSTKFNGAKTVKTNAGMYQNIDGLMFAEAGEEIVSEGGFDAKSAFAGIQGGQVANGSVAPTPTTPPPAQAAPIASTPVVPATDLVQPGGVTPPPPAPIATPPAPVEQSYIVDGKTYTETALLAMPGWTPAHLAGLQRA